MSGSASFSQREKIFVGGDERTDPKVVRHRGSRLVREADLGQELCKSRIRPKTVELRINASYCHIP
jgi:hypothetical protein